MCVIERKAVDHCKQVLCDTTYVMSCDMTSFAQRGGSECEGQRAVLRIDGFVVFVGAQFIGNLINSRRNTVVYMKRK